MRRHGWTTLLAASLCAAACNKSEQPKRVRVEAPETPAAPTKGGPTPSLLERAKSLFGPLPDEAPRQGKAISKAQVALGRALYHDTRLSRNHDLSCATCHALDHFGVDARPEAVEHGTSPGHAGQLGERNSPTVYNAALQFAQFWDGRAADVEEQAKGPLLNPAEMALPNAAQVVQILKSIPGYSPLFQQAFEGADPITFDHVAEAIGAFERKLMTPAPFDAYLKGDGGAISEEAKTGLELFITKGCTTCHMGPGVGGTMFQKLGLIVPYHNTKDEGRFAVTNKPQDKLFFKVPSLRNVAETAPYFHDGSIATLEKAVDEMAEHQTPSGPLPAAEVTKIVTFLKTLTGTPPAKLVSVPDLPESGPNTPKPDPEGPQATAP